MTVAQPQPSDNLNNPSHSKLHRTIASDDAAPDESLYVDASSNMVVKGIDDVGGTNRFTPETVNTTEMNIGLLFFKLSALNSLAIYNMVSGFADEYEDETGVDTANCVNQVYDSVGDYYHPEVEGLDANAKLILWYDDGVGDVAFNLDGTSDYLTFADHDDFYFSGDLTLEFFLYWHVVGDSSFWSQGPNTTNFCNFSRNANTWAITASLSGVNQISIAITDNTTGLNAGVWYHIAFVRSGNDWYLFRDGILKGSDTDAGAFPNYTTDPLLGCLGMNGVPYVAPRMVNGRMREFRISNTARYTTPFAVPTVPFENDANTKLLLHFDEANGARVWTDSSTTGHTVVKHGDVIQKYTTPGWTSAAWLTDLSTSAHPVTRVANAKQITSVYNSTAGYFDGNSDYLTIPDSDD